MARINAMRIKTLVAVFEAIKLKPSRINPQRNNKQNKITINAARAAETTETTEVTENA